MSGLKELKTELEKAKETIAMADRMLESSRHEQERLSVDLPAIEETGETIPVVKPV